jgi:hypothetical protein
MIERSGCDEMMELLNCGRIMGRERMDFVAEEQEESKIPNK